MYSVWLKIFEICRNLFCGLVYGYFGKIFHENFENVFCGFGEVVFVCLQGQDR